jgi:hypothetical protein
MTAGRGARVRRGCGHAHSPATPGARGDGVFIYPPGPIGSTESVPGIRVKAIRDGIQD